MENLKQFWRAWFNPYPNVGDIWIHDSLGTVRVVELFPSYFDQSNIRLAKVKVEVAITHEIIYFEMDDFRAECYRSTI